jgi:hypothetical protein
MATLENKFNCQVIFVGVWLKGESEKKEQFMGKVVWRVVKKGLKCCKGKMEDK